jgi:uncharacterized membrane protein
MSRAERTPSTTAPPTAVPATRYDGLDALRGFAMVWMAGFHLCFDLNQYDLIPLQDFNHQAFWVHQRTAIVSLFLLCAGAGQALNWGQGLGPRFTPSFWRRWWQVVVCAALVSASSAVMFPGAWISFGVLHGMAVMLLILRGLAPLLAPPVARGPAASLAPSGAAQPSSHSPAPSQPRTAALFRLAAWWCVPLAIVLITLPRWLQHPLFDSRLTNWIGLVTRKPITVDWVPVLPWMGLMLLGFALGRWLMSRQAGQRAGPLGALATLGRWPLTFYMVHQPVLIGAIQAGRWLHWW